MIFMTRRMKLTDEQIAGVCRELLASRRRVTWRGVRAVLSERFGATGRNARVCEILRKMAANAPLVPLSGPADLSLIERLERAEKRAALSEERERSQQDYYARRYAERADQAERELQQKYSGLSGEIESLRRRPTAEQYLRVHQQLAEANRRIAEYESGEIPLPQRR